MKIKVSRSGYQYCLRHLFFFDLLKIILVQTTNLVTSFEGTGTKFKSQSDEDEKFCEF